MICSETEAFLVNPEDFLNFEFVDTPQAYEAMLAYLDVFKILQLDSETVGKEALPFFLEQLELEKQMGELYTQYGHLIDEGQAVLEDAKQRLKDIETHLKETLNQKSFRLDEIGPEYRALITERRKAVREAEKRYTGTLAYNKLLKKYESLQRKIEDDESGLLFHRNILALVQLGTLSGRQFLIEPSILDDRFKALLRSRTAIVGMNLKFDLIQLAHHLSLYFDDVPVICYDVMLGAKVLKSGRVRSFSLKELSLEFLNYEQSKEERLSYWLRRPLAPEQAKYAALDVITPGLIFKQLRQLLRDEELVECANLQMDFLKVVTKMELAGLYVDLEGALKLQAEIDELADQKRAGLASELGDEVWFNPEKGINEIKSNKDFGSPKVTLAQLQEYGRKHDIIPLQYLAGTGKDSFEQIEEQIDILDEITEFRSLLHTKENYCQAILNYHVDSRIHSNFIQLQKEGTRMSSNSPNVQNISRPGEWDPSKETFDEALKRWKPRQKLRTLFIAPPGRVLYDADYGAIELCMIAYYSQDPTLLRAIRDGVDLHALTANNIFNLGYTYEQLKDKAVIKEFKRKYSRERYIAKTFNFAVVYGAGLETLQKQLMVDANIYDMSLEEIWSLRESWYATYPGVKTWQENTLSVAKHSGYCTTRLGRRIYFEEPSKVYSKAFNTPIQASCYEGLQQAAIIFNRKVRELELAGIIRPGAITLVNLVHDEFMVEANANINEQSVIRLITESMIEGMQPLMEAILDEKGDILYERVPVSVDCARIERWSDKA
jgi:DNA polymerase I-like protein with 3'-5' exonuclease and polymerase domains